MTQDKNFSVVSYIPEYPDTGSRVFFATKAEAEADKVRLEVYDPRLVVYVEEN